MRDHDFFATAREREKIRLLKDGGYSPPWTTDPIFERWRFCNVRREDDRVTRWFRRNIRSKVNGRAAVRAIIAFRMFNKIDTGEILKSMLLNDEWNSREAHRLLSDVRPVCNGAYIVSSPQGYDKLTGVLYIIDQAIALLGDIDVECWRGLQHAWTFLRVLPYIGPFNAYEIVTDLRWTDVLSNANDIMTWANPGPGCARGLGRVWYNDPTAFNRGSAASCVDMLEKMRELLHCSRLAHYWPQDWATWEMREVEHWLCEFDKYERARKGERLKRRYKCS